MKKETNISTTATDYEDGKLIKRMMNTYLNKDYFTSLNLIKNSENTSLNESGDFINSTRIENSSAEFENDSLIGDKKYYERLFYIYNCFRNLKANANSMNLIFGEDLVNSFREDAKRLSPSDLAYLNEDNLIRNIFNQYEYLAFVKLENRMIYLQFNQRSSIELNEAKKQLEVKEIVIKELQRQLFELEVENKKTPKGVFAIGKKENLNKVIQIFIRNKNYLNELTRKIKVNKHLHII